MGSKDPLFFALTSPVLVVANNRPFICEDKMVIN